MRHETISLTVPGAEGSAPLTLYLPDNFPELGMDRRRPAIIICPGGGYRFCSDREGEPVALRFLGLGYAAFVLRYHTGEKGRWPIPQRQLLAAIAHVRSHAEEYHVDPKAVVVMGFSAGGHLAGCAGTMWDRPELCEGLEGDLRPDGMVLCYPVVTSGEKGHAGSFRELLGPRHDELLDSVSLEKCARADAPSTFLWHTADDTTVPMENSVLLRDALMNAGVDTQCRIYPHGAHGQSLADKTVYDRANMWKLSLACAGWVDHCHMWLQLHFG